MLSRVEISRNSKSLEGCLRSIEEVSLEARLYETDLDSIDAATSSSAGAHASQSEGQDGSDRGDVVTACRRFLRPRYVHWLRAWLPRACFIPNVTKRAVVPPLVFVARHSTDRPARRRFAHLGSGVARACCRPQSIAALAALDHPLAVNYSAAVSCCCTVLQRRSSIRRA